MSVSNDVVIMTTAELEAERHRWFHKGVKRGEFEAGFRKSSDGPSNREETPVALEAATDRIVDARGE